MRSRVVLLLILGLLAWVQSSHAATRLGLQVTQEELNIWRTRMTDNVNTINGFTYQSIYTNRLKGPADTFVAQAHPGGDGMWAGNTSAGCQPAESTSFGPGRGSGQYMGASAFVFLLTNTTSYAVGVRANLIAMANDPNLNFANTAKWCTPGYQNGVEIQTWVSRMILAYDYLKAGNYSGLSAGDKTLIEGWLKSAANWFFGNYYSFSNAGFYNYNFFSSKTCLGFCTVNEGPWYFGGHNAARASENLTKTSDTGNILLGMLAGILTNDATMVARAKTWISNFVPTVINNIGAFAQYRRWFDCPAPCPGSMWGHAGGTMAQITLAIDALARTGDTSLYTVSGATGVPGSPAGTVSWLTAVQKFAQLANSTAPLYAYVGSTQSTELTWDSDVDAASPRKGNYYDFSSMAANIYYQDSQIRTAMTRTTMGSNSITATAGCNDSQFGSCFSAVYAGWWPDVPFMLGNLDSGQINPYVVGTLSAPPVVTITAPTSSPTYTAGSSPLTTLAGTPAGATDDVGVLSVTWDCPTCTPTSGTATCASCGAAATSVAWSVGSIGLAQGTNVITVRATDADGQTGADVLTVTLPLTSLRLDAGGTGMSASDGVYVADQYFTGGNTANIATAIAGTTDDGLYQTERWGSFSYAIPIANGTYSVTLKFAELFWTSGTAHRVFHVDIEGVRVLTNFDLQVEGGSAGFAAIDRTFSTTVSDGTLNMVWTPVAGDPEVTAIVVVPASGSAPPAVLIQQPTADPAYAAAVTPLTTLQGTASDDVGVSSVSVACSPSCGTPTVSCPTCGATATTAAWSVASLPLTAGRTVITVTATDTHSQTSTDTLTVGLPVACYSFDGTVADVTGLGHTGTLTGGATYTTLGNGILNQALLLDGVNDYVSVAHATDLNVTGDMSVDFWAYYGSVANNQTILSKEDVTAPNNTPYHVEINNPGTPQYQWYHHLDPGNFSAILNFNSYTIPLNTWHHVAFIRSGGTVSLWINGAAVQLHSTWTDQPGSNTRPVTIGTDPQLSAGSFLNGRLDELCLYPYALSASEITARASGGMPPAPLVLQRIVSP